MVFPISRFALGKKSVSTAENTSGYVPRKRLKLDHLTEEQKIVRRKILNREAAQKARDRKRDLMENLEHNLATVQVENECLRAANRALRSRFLEQEQKLTILQKKLTGILESLGKNRSIRIEPSESAELLPQQKGVALWILSVLYLSSLLNSASPPNRARSILTTHSPKIFMTVKLLKYQLQKRIPRARLRRFRFMNPGVM